MSIHIPPDLERSLKRIEDYCHLIRRIVIERHTAWKQDADEETDKIISESIKISDSLDSQWD